MEQDVTWYEVLGVLPGAEPHRIRREYEARSGLLRPEMIAGAPSNVLTAVARAQDRLDSAWQVLSDPATRRCYDQGAGLRRTGGGLDGPGSGPIQTGFDPDDLGPAGELLADVASPVLVLFGGRVRRPQRRAPAAVPDVRGLFTGTCREVARRHGLEVTAVRLTERPMPVEGLVVSQDPAPGARCRGGRLTVQVWHPPFRNPS
ncbi:MAG TPA: DnaJ domain-containing protein [Candidatus Eisenbacteria bacterium]|nr:DnaJ domain-containing protein [Candidatus Eisenbacteria bacterium]